MWIEVKQIWAYKYPFYLMNLFPPDMFPEIGHYMVALVLVFGDLHPFFLPTNRKQACVLFSPYPCQHLLWGKGHKQLTLKLKRNRIWSYEAKVVYTRCLKTPKETEGCWNVSTVFYSTEFTEREVRMSPLIWSVITLSTCWMLATWHVLLQRLLFNPVSYME